MTAVRSAAWSAGTPTITASSATGNVTGGDASFVGGLVGLNTEGAITQSSAIGAVTAGEVERRRAGSWVTLGGPISASWRAGGTVIAAPTPRPAA